MAAARSGGLAVSFASRILRAIRFHFEGGPLSFGVRRFRRVIAMRRIAIGRLVGLLLALIGIGLSVWFARDAMRRNADFYEWLDARPMETAIDLSRLGETTASFHQTCGISHGEALYLDFDLDEAASLNFEELFKGLSGNITIIDSAGKEIEMAGISGETVQHWDGQFMLTEFAPFRSGNYIASIRINSGAPNLADIQQTIYAKYQLCGLERMPATIAGVFAFGAGFIGLVSAACVFPGLLQSGLWYDSSTENN